MGHALNIGAVNKESDILNYARDFAFYNTDRMENRSGSYHGNMTVVKNRTFNSFEEAAKYLKDRFIGYKDGAVRFRDVESIKLPRSITAKEDSLKRLQKKFSEERSENHFSEHKSKFISCPHCESKIRSGFIKKRNATHIVNKCPVCEEDMRPESVLKRIESKSQKIDRLRVEIDSLKKEYYNKVAKKAPVKWAVKVEVHC